MILALVTDLIFSTKIVSTAQSIGVPAKVVRTLDQLRSHLATGGLRLVLIDLNADGVDVLEAIGICCASASSPCIIAYASHVQTELIDQARQAGADQVLARSAFVSKLPVLLQQAVSE